MPIRKIGICSIIFIIIIASGWLLDNMIRNHWNHATILPQSTQRYYMFSTYDSLSQYDYDTPYFPREYVRIVRLNKEK